MPLSRLRALTVARRGPRSGSSRGTRPGRPGRCPDRGAVPSPGGGQPTGVDPAAHGVVADAEHLGGFREAVGPHPSMGRGSDRLRASRGLSWSVTERAPQRPRGWSPTDPAMARPASAAVAPPVAPSAGMIGAMRDPAGRCSVRRAARRGPRRPCRRRCRRSTTWTRSARPPGGSTWRTRRAPRGLAGHRADRTRDGRPGRGGCSPTTDASSGSGEEESATSVAPLVEEHVDGDEVTAEGTRHRWRRGPTRAGTTRVRRGGGDETVLVYGSAAEDLAEVIASLR